MPVRAHRVQYFLRSSTVVRREPQGLVQIFFTTSIIEENKDHVGTLKLNREGRRESNADRIRMWNVNEEGKEYKRWRISRAVLGMNIRTTRWIYFILRKPRMITGQLLIHISNKVG